MNGTTFNQLLHFHTIVKEGSITKAAQKLEIASPSVSNSLKALEKELGLPLFTRTTRKMELTDAGRQLFENTLNSVSDLNSAIESVSDLNKTPSGKVRITMPRFVFQIYLKDIYMEFCERYPEIELEISTNDATVDILNEGIDVGIRFGDKIEENMIARQFTSPLKEAFFASPEYIKQHGKPKTLTDLRQHKMIQYRFIASKQLAPLKFMQKGEEVIVDMPTAMIVNDTDVVVDATLKHIGIGRMIEPLVQELLAQKAVVPILEKNWMTYPGLYIYFHKNTQKAKRVRALIDFLLEKKALF